MMPDRHDEMVPSVARLLAMQLWGVPIPTDHAEWKYEEAYQRWIGESLIRRFLNEKYPGQFNVQVEPESGTPGSGKIVPVKAFGTSFWPDVSVESSGGELLVAVEVKCLLRRSLPGQLSRGLGQALMYRQIYRQSLLVLVPLDQLSMAPPPFFANVSEHGIEMTIIGGVAAPGVSSSG